MSGRLFCNRFGQGQRQGRGQRAGNRTGSGPGDNCVCPKCGHKLTHAAVRPCKDIACPKCGTKMVCES